MFFKKSNLFLLTTETLLKKKLYSVLRIVKIKTRKNFVMEILINLLLLDNDNYLKKY